MNIKCKCGFLEEIHGFKSPGEYNQFISYLERQVQEKNLEKLDSDKDYEKGLIYGGTWYKCTECNETWRLVQPEPPFTGLWERVEE